MQETHSPALLLFAALFLKASMLYEHIRACCAKTNVRYRQNKKMLSPRQLITFYVSRNVSAELY